MHAQYPYLQPRTIPMSPGPENQVAWEVHDIPSLEGFLYTSQNIPAASEVGCKVVETVVELAHANKQSAVARECDFTGGFADCHKIGSLLIKNFRPRNKRFAVATYDTYMGLSAVRANVMLSTGFEIANQQWSTKVGSKLTRSAWKAPQMYAAYIPHDDTDRPVWAMSFEEGEPLKDLPGNFLSSIKRITRYRRAIEYSGGDPDSVDYDDNATNILVNKKTCKTIYTKLDVMAKQTYEW